MAQFTLEWNNDDAEASANNLTFTAEYRKKSVGGAWLTTGFTPSNNMATSVDTAETDVLDSNNVYEFRVVCNCTQNGPALNTNGLKEQIGFACIVPDIVNEVTTSAITLDLTNTDITKVNFVLRRSSDNVIMHNLTVNRAGNSATTVASSLVAATNYYWQVVMYANVNGVEVASSHSDYLNAVCGPYPVLTDDAPAMDLVWIADEVACETEGGFALVKEITGLSSPFITWYDEVNEVMYVGDNDHPSGNVYWFDPATATVPGDMTHSAAVMGSTYYNGLFDPEHRRIYFIGQPTGMRVYDIDTDSASTIEFGGAGTFKRVSMLLTPTHVIVYDVSIGSGAFVFINRTTLAIDTTLAIGSVPNNTRFAIGAFNMVAVGSEIWIVAGSGSSVSSVGVYSSDFLTNHANITLTGAALWDGARYWQSGFHDPTDNKFYVGEWGSSRRMVIDVATRTVLDNRVVNNRGGKTNALHFWGLNPITNEIILMVSMQDDSTDATAIRRTYIENRGTYDYKAMFTDQAYSSLSRITGTNQLIGSLPGNTFWSGDPDYEIDGSLTVVTNSAGGDNTGTQIIVTLQEVDANNGNLPTGETKPNVPEDEDYIEPIEDSEDCELVFTEDCPVHIATTFSGATLEYEFYITNAVKNNPDIAKIQIYARNIDTASNEGTPYEISAPFTSNIFSGSIGGLGGSNYTIKVKYLDSGDLELQDC